MAGEFGQSVANALLNQVLRGEAAYAPPSSYWLGLFKASTGLRLSTPGTWQEVTAGEYARLEIRGSTGKSFTLSTTGASANNEAWTWGTATVAWGTITHVAILDSATLGAGTVVFYGQLVSPQVVGIGDYFRFQASDFDVTL
jgi:hypothetical protein